MTPEDSLLAAELALGLVEPEKRAAAVRRALADPTFAGAVDRWREDLAALAAEVPEVEPPLALQARIITAITQENQVVSHGDTARRWRWATATLSALAAVLLATIALDRYATTSSSPAPAPAPRATTTLLTAMLGPAATGGAPNAAIYDSRSGQLRFAAPIAIPRGRSAELWSIGGDGVPHALGLLVDARARAMTVRIAVRARVVAGATLAISIEPAGGSPGAAPTGPVIATGELAPI